MVTEVKTFLGAQNNGVDVELIETDIQTFIFQESVTNCHSINIVSTPLLPVDDNIPPTTTVNCLGDDI